MRLCGTFLYLCGRRGDTERIAASTWKVSAGVARKYVRLPLLEIEVE
jgi:hypothetical protein